MLSPSFEDAEDETPVPFHPSLEFFPISVNELSVAHGRRPPFFPAGGRNPPSGSRHVRPRNRMTAYLSSHCGIVREAAARQPMRRAELLRLFLS
jgi:hypothetical protein